MPRIAGPDGTSAPPGVDLCRILHPSSGLPGRVVLSLLEPADAHGGAGDTRLADVVPIDDDRRFGSGRPARRRPRP